MNGFSLAGTPDSGTFNPLLLQVDTPIIRFALDPARDRDPTDKCHTHEREAFRDLTKLVNVTLFVDFPMIRVNATLRTHKTLGPPKPRLIRSLPFLCLCRRSCQHLLAAIYFFGTHGSDCEGPGIVSGGQP